MDAYSVDQLAVLRAPDYKNAAGALVDPTTVVFKAKIVGREQLDAYLVYGQAAEVVKEAVGKYRVDFHPDEPGWWAWKITATGPGASAVEGMFYVRPEAIA